MIDKESWKKLIRSQSAERAMIQYNYPGQLKALSRHVIIADKFTVMGFPFARPLEQFAVTANRQITLKKLVSSNTPIYGSSRKTDTETHRNQVK